ncbi:hypothetical protein EVAR_36512_1 [Eumeta japonica]|uniref:Uncharacterized protein n=1 Tax=Eumeta variegata TaxID=151549 RepID=A0A4C1XBN8_EUMVA|nr:hypothetical protein EVAR_36512_1 [Eumeta japonica]
MYDGSIGNDCLRKSYAYQIGGILKKEQILTTPNSRACISVKQEIYIEGLETEMLHTGLCKSETADDR